MVMKRTRLDGAVSKKTPYCGTETNCRFSAWRRVQHPQNTPQERRVHSLRESSSDGEHRQQRGIIEQHVQT